MFHCHRDSQLALILVSSFALISTGLQAGPPTDGKDMHCGRAASVARQMRSDPCASEEVLMPPPLDPALAADTDVLHYDLTVDIDFVTETIDGYNIMTVRSLIDGLTDFDVRIRSNFTLSDLAVDGTPASYTRLDTPTIRVHLPRAYDTGETFALAIGWQGQPRSLGFGSFEFFTHNGVDGASTLSEPYYAYTWWASKDENTDKAVADIRVIVPSTFSVASNGTLQGVDDLGSGRSLHHWKTDYQIATYLVSLGVTNYNRFSSVFDYDGGSMPVEFFIYPERDTSTNRNGWLKCINMLAVFSDIYGLYPFINEKYGIYNFPFGGGMEHQTMTGQGDFGESLTAHELAHQWWGDDVTCETWSDIWLNEGFATYSECLWEEYKNGGDNRTALRNAINDRRPFTWGNPVYVEDTSDFNRIFSTSSTYYKGAWILHMIRRIVGDESFFDILALHRARHTGDSATSAEFQQTCETVHGGSLDWFFAPWLYEPGAISWRYNYRNLVVNGVKYGEVMLKQTQTTGWPLFTMPVDLRLNTSAGAQNFTVWNFARKQHYLFPLPADATSLSVDPDSWVLTDTRGTAAFEESPPKVITSSPVIGSTNRNSPSAISVGFQKNIVTPVEADFALTGLRTGSHAFTLSYDPATFLATITPDSPLPADTYTLTVQDSIRDFISGQQLDGEIFAELGASTGNALPSGDGVPAGSAFLSFTIGPDIRGNGINRPPVHVGPAER